MRAFLVTVCLASLLVSVGACRFLTGNDDEEPFYFEVTYEDVEADGTGHASIEDGILVVRGEYLNSDSSTRYVELTVAEFDGEQMYVLHRTDGIYGAIEGDESEPYGYSSGRPEDSMRIDDYDADRGVLIGAFFFHGTAYQDFDDIGAFFPFRVAGRFRTRVN